jgi:hypothetical protein
MRTLTPIKAMINLMVFVMGAKIILVPITMTRTIEAETFARLLITRCFSQSIIASPK